MTYASDHPPDRQVGGPLCRIFNFIQSSRREKVKDFVFTGWYGRPVARRLATAAYGIVVITDVSGEIVDPEQIAEHHPAATEEHVWAGWRPSTLDELVHTWPARSEAGAYERLRGWWNPTLDELREARRAAKPRERRKSESAGTARRGAAL